MAETTKAEATLPLFERLAAPARAGNAVQQAAADEAAPRVGTQARRILTLLATAGDLTADEIQFHTGIRRSSICGRLGELEHPLSPSPALLAPDALVAKVGRRQALTSDNLVNLYTITPAGRHALQTPPPRRKRRPR